MRILRPVLFLTLLAGCPSESTETTTSTQASTTSSGAECTPGDLGCSCVEGKCLEGYICFQDKGPCIVPDNQTTGEPTTGGASTTGSSCPAGLDYCPCAPGDLCAPGLECSSGICWPSPMVPTTGEVCLDDYEACSSQLDCCEDKQHCLDFSATNGGGVLCVPECTTHTECPSKCCGAVQDIDIHVCYSSPCEELCANTCSYSFDGECDDGGSGADTRVCEYGTDCADCGTRSSDAAPW